jgi:hypothetical protein
VEENNDSDTLTQIQQEFQPVVKSLKTNSKTSKINSEYKDSEDPASVYYIKIRGLPAKL